MKIWWKLSVWRSRLTIYKFQDFVEVTNKASNQISGFYSITNNIRIFRKSIVNVNRFKFLLHNFFSHTTMTTDQGMWIIGYGSLIFKPPPHVSFKVNGFLRGFIRRFWQSSSDHRGTVESPGRVVTLVSLDDLKSNPHFHDSLYLYELKQDDVTVEKKELSLLKSKDLRVWGVAYYIAPEHVEEVKEYLDVREQDGYSTHKVPFHFTSVENHEDLHVAEVLKNVPRDPNTNDRYIESVIYIGTTDNVSFVGPEPIEDTAAKIKVSRGPSGPNTEYLLKLNEAVKNIDQNSVDSYLQHLVELVEGQPDH